jgi:hypothetical protein
MFNDLSECQETNEKISLMISQADEQLKDGTLNISDYRVLLAEVQFKSQKVFRDCSNLLQVVQINEASKLREAQRRDEQENWSESNCWHDEDSQGNYFSTHIERNVLHGFFLSLCIYYAVFYDFMLIYFAFCLVRFRQGQS